MKVRRIIWIVLSLLSLAGISYYGGVISYSFFYACILLPVISGLYLLYVHTRFSVYQEIDTRNIVCKQAIPYRFTLQNDDFIVYTGIKLKLFSSYSSVDDLEDNEIYRLFPGDRIRKDTQLVCKYRGEYEVGVKEITLHDFFGIFRVKYKMPSTIRALVSPRIVRINELRSISRLSTMLEADSKCDKVELDVVVRDYIRGDSLKKVHWKNTARQQSMKVRMDIGSERRKITVFFDCRRASADMGTYLPLENKILETVVALLHYFIRQNMSIQLVWEKDKPEKRDVVDLRYFEQVFRELSLLSFQENVATEDSVEKAWAGRMFTFSSIVIMVLHEISPKTYAIARELVKEEKMVVLYVITKEDISEYIRESSMRLHIVVIDPEQELGEVL